MEKTQIRRMEQYKDRWSSFGSGTGILQISEKLSAEDLKEFEIFEDFDDKFLEQVSPDVSVALWKQGAVLFEEGSFIDLAFFLVKGEVAVSLEKASSESTTSGPIFNTSLMSLRKSPGSTVVLPPPSSGKAERQPADPEDGAEVTFLSAMDFNMPADSVMKLGAGEIFGEIGALNGWPQSVTANTLSECLIVQIRLPALRLMKRKSKAFKERIDLLYRDRSLVRQLKASPLFMGCDDISIIQLAAVVELVSCGPEETVVEEGHPADALYLVRSGFMKVSEKRGEGRIAVSYLSKGMPIGEVELLLKDLETWKFTVSSVGYSELVKIPQKNFYKLIRLHPDVEKQLWKQAVATIKETGHSRRNPQRSEFIQFSLDKGLVEGNSILVIDLNACTRCDDCVRACADTHGGRPRFVREGDRYENLLITKACYHCEDPVCLIGCPTGAIRRANVGDVVEIQENICIGCATCANNCPYDAIVMHQTGLTWPDDALPKPLRGKDRDVASKCDLCFTSEKGPACVRSCPQGCAYRVGSVEAFRQLPG